MTDPLESGEREAEAFRRAYARTPVPASEARARAIASAIAGRRPYRSMFGRWFEPSLTLRPVVAVGAAIALLAAGALLAHRFDGRTRPIEGSSGPATAAVATQAVHFVFVDRSASRVALVGDFNGWAAEASPLHRNPSDGAWVITVALSPGWHSYAFLVNGADWVADPQAPLAPADGFGTPRSVVVVEEHGT